MSREQEALLLTAIASLLLIIFLGFRDHENEIIFLKRRVSQLEWNYVLGENIVKLPSEMYGNIPNMFSESKFVDSLELKHTIYCRLKGEYLDVCIQAAGNTRSRIFCTKRCDDGYFDLYILDRHKDYTNFWHEIDRLKQEVKQ